MEEKTYDIVDSVETLEKAIARVKEAQKIFSTYTQEQVDKIFLAAATEANKMRIPLAKLAVEETGMGIVEDKIIKNHFASEYIYNKYRNKNYNTNEMRTLINKLLMDEDVTKQAGIIPYVLSDRTFADEKHLSIRAFPEQMKRRVYEKQGYKCAICTANGVDTVYDFADMQGDHIVPWSKGGKTIESNLQMLCRNCNTSKSNK